MQQMIMIMTRLLEIVNPRRIILGASTKGMDKGQLLFTALKILKSKFLVEELIEHLEPSHRS